MQHYAQSETYTQIGLDIINSNPDFEHLKGADVRVAFLSCTKLKRSKNKVTFGECIKVTEINKVFNPYDFFIVIYEPNVENFTDTQIKILIEHELMHIGVEYKDGEAIYYLVPHDLEDFKNIIDKYGTDWAEV